jgi:hypothetical protein
VSYEGKPIRIVANFSTEKSFQAMKENNYQPILIYAPKLYLIIQREVKIFHNKQNLNKFMITKPELQKILKRILYEEEENKCNSENTRKNESL